MRTSVEPTNRVPHAPPLWGREAAEQRDAADEGRLEACGRIIVGTVIVNEGKVVRPSQLIASVRRTVARRA